jgi:hypothetical protein
MNKFKIIKIFLFSIILILTLLVISFGYYIATKENSENYITDDFHIYAKVGSVKNLYANLIDLKAVDYILSDTQYSELYKYVLDFRNMDISRNNFLLNFLNIPLYLKVDNTDNFTLIADLKYFSLFTKIINPVKFADNLEKTADGKYRLQLSDKYLYLTFHKNLIFLSSSENPVEVKKENTVNKNMEIKQLSRQVRSGSLVEIYLGSSFIIKNTIGLNPMIDNFLSRAELGKYSLIHFFLSNEDLFVSLDSAIFSDDIVIQNIINKRNKSINVLKYLSDNTNLFFKSDIGNIKDAYDLFVSTLPNDKKRQISSLERGIELFFNMSLSDMIFDWPGTEFGAIYTDNPYSPIYFTEVRDKKKFESVLSDLDRLNVLVQGRNLVFDGVRLAKFEFPPVMRTFVKMFMKNTEMPYFIQLDNYIFLSQDPQILSSMINKYNGNMTLPFDESFKTAMKKTGVRPDILLYYNTEKSRFTLFDNAKFLDKIVNLYKLGIFAVSTERGRINVTLSAAGSDKFNVTDFPGFPRPLSEKLKGEVKFADISGRRVPSIVYMSDNGDLISKTITFEEEFSVSFGGENNSFYIDRKEKSLIIFSAGGAVYKTDYQGNSLNPFPLLSSYRGLWTPVRYNNSFYYFSPQDMKLHGVDMSGKTFTLNHKFSSSLLSEISISENYIAASTRSQSGEIILLDFNGNIQSGFPYYAGSLIRSSPVIDKGNIYFVTQNGVFHGINRDGSIIKGFPVNLGGVFNVSVNILKRGNDVLFSLLDNSGRLIIVNLSGKVINEAVLQGDTFRNAAIISFDLNSDGNEELFIYGGGNYIFCYDNNLSPYPGFPVKGFTKPDFIDIDRDGNMEMLTASIDNKLYIYTIMR